MKSVALVLLLASFSSTAYARVSLFKKEVKPDNPTSAPIVQEEPKKSSPPKISKDNSGLNRSWSYVSRGVPLILLAQPQGRVIDELKSGLIVNAVIPQSVIAFGGSEAEVTAQVEISGERFVALGKASLEPNSKRILVEFDRVRRIGSNQLYRFKAHALDERGVAGVEGEYESGATRFFLAQLLSSFASGMLDSSVSRSKTAFGQVVEDQTLEDKGKKAAAQASADAANRFGDRVKYAPEYSILEGPIRINLLVEEQPMVKSSN